MSESGVIPRPEDREPPAALGYAEDIDGLRLYVGVHLDRVYIEAGDIHLCLAKDQREQFMRLWCEAERQAEATMPP